MSGTWLMICGVAAGYLALAAILVALLGGRSRKRVSAGRRSPVGPMDASAEPSGYTGPGRAIVNGFDAILVRTNRKNGLAAALEGAGKKVGPGAYSAMILLSTLVAGVIGWQLFGWVLAVLLALAVPLTARLVLKILAGRRRTAFADQLDNTLQMLAGSLRAGHSLLRAVDAVASEAEEPVSTEFAQILNETRVGRELGDSLEATALRMASDDFSWAAQAIAIHQEVGGDLAQVLDTVANTIRERNQIARQVKALSAEGRLSGIVLMLLPVGVAGFLTLTNPSFIGRLTQSPIGWAMIAAALVLMIVGGLWLRKVVSIKF